MSALIGAVVVHWRGMDDTEECLASLARLDYPPTEVVVVVNGSGDFDAGRARAALPSVEVVESGSNLGYAGGCNLGAKTLLGRGAEFLMFLNNDIVVEPALLTDLARLFDDENDAGVAGPVVTYYDEPDRVWSAGGRLLPLLGVTRHVGFRSHDMPIDVRRVDFVPGSAFAVRREVYERADGIDEAYFHYFEDVDFCDRARALGYASYLIPAPLVRHKVSAAAGKRGSNRLNRVQSYYFTRNRIRFIRKNFRAPQKYVPLLAQVVMVLPYEVLKSLLALNVGAMRGQLAGAFDGFCGVSGPLGARPANRAHADEPRAT